MRNMKRLLSGVLCVVCMLVVSLGVTTRAAAFTALDPNQLFYITGSVSMTEISTADADENGNYPLSYAARTVVPETLGSYIVRFAQYVTSFSFRLDVQMTTGLVPNEDSVVLDCAFGELENVSVVGRMMYIDVILKPGTQATDYSLAQWTSPINLHFDASLSGDAFSVGDSVTVTMGVSGYVTGSHVLVGEQEVTVHGTMDPAYPTIETRMVAGTTVHQPEEAIPPDQLSTVPGAQIPDAEKPIVSGTAPPSTDQPSSTDAQAEGTVGEPGSDDPTTDGQEATNQTPDGQEKTQSPDGQEETQSPDGQGSTDQLINEGKDNSQMTFVREHASVLILIGCAVCVLILAVCIGVWRKRSHK